MEMTEVQRQMIISAIEFRYGDAKVRDTLSEIINSISESKKNSLDFLLSEFIIKEGISNPDYSSERGVLREFIKFLKENE